MTCSNTDQMHIINLARMHDNDNMAAIQRVHIPSHLHQHDIQTSVIKSSYRILAKVEEENSFHDDSVGLDDDDFSDHDSHYSEDLIDDSFEESPQYEEDKPPDIAQRLLSFAEMVNADIQKYFGKKKDDDSCDIYEDKWEATKSGRELYYADLLRIAQGENVDSKSSKDTASPISQKEGIDNKHKFTGKKDPKVGLGPLNELFEYGLRHFLTDKKIKAKKVKRVKQDVKKFDDVMPMHQRKLPNSFWREPGADRQTDVRVNGTTASLLSNSHPPDFSDLLQSWTGLEEEDFNGELSSSEMSVTTSPESMEQI